MSFWCNFAHKWSKWEEYIESGMCYGGVFSKLHAGVPYSERKQKRVCERCGKVVEERIN